MNNAQNYSEVLSLAKVKKLGINKDHEVCSLKQLTGHCLPEHQHIFCILLQNL